MYYVRAWAFKLCFRSMIRFQESRIECSSKCVNHLSFEKVTHAALSVHLSASVEKRGEAADLLCNFFFNQRFVTILSASKAVPYWLAAGTVLSALCAEIRSPIWPRPRHQLLSPIRFILDTTVVSIIQFKVQIDYYWIQIVSNDFRRIVYSSGRRKTTG